MAGSTVESETTTCFTGSTEGLDVAEVCTVARFASDAVFALLMEVEECTGEMLAAFTGVVDTRTGRGGTGWAASWPGSAASWCVLNSSFDCTPTITSRTTVATPRIRSLIGDFRNSARTNFAA